MAIIYRDMEYDFGGGGEIPSTATLKNSDSLEKVNFAIVDSKTNQPKVVTLKVEQHGSFNVNKISQSSEIVALKRLYSLSKNIEEFNHYSMLFNQVFKDKKPGIPNPQRYSIESFSSLILALKEINNIIPTEIDIMKIKSILLLEEEFLKNKRYLVFSTESYWKEFAIGATIEFGKLKIKQTYKNGFVNSNFSLSEIKSVIKKRIELQGSNLERVALIVYSEFFDFNILINHMSIYFKNQALLKEYDIDFDKIDIKKKETLSHFMLKINNVSSYKILNKLLQRLNASHREEILKNEIIFNSFLAFANKMNYDNLNFSQIEPILKRIHTYSDVNILLNALYGIVSEFNIYDLSDRCKKISGAEIVYFNESDQVAILKITRYNAMKIFGSPLWCVQHIEEKYQYYTGGLRRFYIFIDAKSKHKSLSKIGFTIKPNGKILEACDLENRHIPKDLDDLFYSKYGKYMKGFFFRNARP